MASDLTDTEARALGERWVKAGGFEPFTPPTPTGPLAAPYIPAYERDERGILWRREGSTWWPDLRDPATKGAAVGFLRERTGRNVVICPVRMYGHEDAIVLSGQHKGQPVGPDGWGAYGMGLDALPVGRSEEEVIVAATEAAPALVRLPTLTIEEEV